MNRSSLGLDSDLKGSASDVKMTVEENKMKRILHFLRKKHQEECPLQHQILYEEETNEPSYRIACKSFILTVCLSGIVILMLLLGYHSFKEKVEPITALQYRGFQSSNPNNVYLHIILKENELFYDLNATLERFKEKNRKINMNIIILYNYTIEVDNRKEWNEMKLANTFNTLNRFGVKLVQTTLNNFFKDGPLEQYWRNMAPEMIPFVLRVMTIWNSGGITMPWRLFYATNMHPNIFNSKTNEINKTINWPTLDNSKYLTFTSGKDFEEFIAFNVKRNLFENAKNLSMPKYLDHIYTDRMGYYFSTEFSCHAFLGAVISELQSGKNLVDPSIVMYESLKKFCSDKKLNECKGIQI